MCNIVDTVVKCYRNKTDKKCSTKAVSNTFFNKNILRPTTPPTPRCPVKAIYFLG